MAGLYLCPSSSSARFPASFRHQVDGSPLRQCRLGSARGAAADRAGAFHTEFHSFTGSQLLLFYRYRRIDIHDWDGSRHRWSSQLEYVQLAPFRSSQCHVCPERGCDSLALSHDLRQLLLGRYETGKARQLGCEGGCGLQPRSLCLPSSFLRSLCLHGDGCG